MARRILAGSLGLAVVLLALPSAALAAPPGGACPAANSGWVRVDREAWWFDWTVPGFAQEGIDVYDGEEFSAEFEQFARDFGFESAQALMDWVLGEQWATLDLNENDFLCIKDAPNTPGYPGYLFLGKDDKVPS